MNTSRTNSHPVVAHRIIASLVRKIFEAARNIANQEEDADLEDPSIYEKKVKDNKVVHRFKVHRRHKGFM